MHAARHDADDLIIAAPDAEGEVLLQRLLVEETEPELIADHGDGQRSARRVTGVEGATDGGFHPEDVEQCRRHVGDELVFDRVSRLDARRRQEVWYDQICGMESVPNRRVSFFERRCVPRFHRRSNRVCAAGGVIGNDRIDQGVQEREHRRVHGERETKRQDSYDGEDWTLGQRSNRIGEVRSGHGARPIEGGCCRRSSGHCATRSRKEGPPRRAHAPRPLLA